MTIVNYASSGINKLKASLNDARVIIYNCHMFIVQDTGLWAHYKTDKQGQGALLDFASQLLPGQIFHSLNREMKIALHESGYITVFMAAIKTSGGSFYWRFEFSE